MSFSSEDSSWSDEISEQESMKLETDESSKVKKLKRVIVIQVVLLVVMIAVAILLTYVFSVNLYKNIYEGEVIHETRDFFEYPFYHPSDGKTKIQGTVRSPVPITEPMSIFTDEGEQVMLIMGEESGYRGDVAVYMVATEIFCCPIDREDRNSLVGCRLMVTRNFEWAGTDSETVRDEVLESIQGSIQFDIIKKRAGRPVCPEGYEVIVDFVRIIRTEEKMIYKCQGWCTNTQLDAFLAKHPELADEDPKIVDELHLDASHFCREYSSRFVIDDGTMGNEAVGEKFEGLLDAYCDGVNIGVETDKLSFDMKKINRVCVAGGGDCEFGTKVGMENYAVPGNN